MTIIVHHLENSRSQRVLWMLEELGLAYEIRRYERNKATMLAPPELRRVHPLGKSPVIQDTANGNAVLAETETDRYIARYPVRSLVAAGSSLKFCCLAEGRADLYPRMGPTMQWDTAAGDAVLRAAGGRTLTLDGVPLAYGPGAGQGGEAYRNPWFVALGDCPLARQP